MAGTAKKVVVVSGTITQSAAQVRVGSNTSIIGKNSGAKLVNFGLYVGSSCPMCDKPILSVII